jgi:hypothetical protein
MFYSGYAFRRSSSQEDAPEYKLEELFLFSVLDSVSFILLVLKE